MAEQDFFEGKGSPVPEEEDFFGGVGTPVQEAAKPSAAEEDFFQGKGTPIGGPESRGKSLESGILLDQELNQISSDTGVPVAHLRTLVPYFGARSESDKSLEAKLKRAAGFLDEAVLMGAGKAAYKKLAASPAEEKALDIAQQKAEERKSGLETAGELAVGSLLPIGGAAKAVTLGEKALAGAKIGAGLGAVSGFTHSKAGEELGGAVKGATFGAAGGALLPVVFNKAGDVLKKLVAKNPSAVGRAENEIQEQMAKQAGGLQAQAAAITDSINTGIRPEQSPEVTAALKDFYRHVKSSSLVDDAALEGIGPNRALEGLQKVQNEMGQDWMAREIKNWQTVNVADEVLGQKLAQVSPRDATLGNRVKRFLLDGRAQARRIDRLTGVTSLEPLMDSASRKMNQMKLQMQTMYGEAVPVMKELESLGADKLTAEDLRLAEEKGIDALPETLRPALRAYQQYLTAGENSVLKQLQASGIPVTELAAEKGKIYIPRLTKDTPEAVGLVLDRANALGINPRQNITEETFEKALASPAGKELIEGAEWLSKRKIEDANDLGLALKEVLNPSEVTARLRKTIRAAQSRSEAGVPDFLRETDLAKLTGRYLHDTLESATMQPIVQDLTLQARLAKKAKDWDSADSIETLIRDLNGQREGTVASFASRMADELKLKALQTAKSYEASGNETAATVANWVADAPDFFNAIQKNVYPNFLGANPRAAINNLTQSFFVTAPELGGVYGTGKVLKAAAKTLAESRGLFGKGLLKAEMEASGQLGPQAHQEAYSALRDGLVQSKGFKGVAKATLDKAASAAMGVFELSERLNRRIVQNVASDVAKDLIAKAPGGNFGMAAKFLENLGPAYRSRIEQAVKAGNNQETTRLLENYLTGKTMFSYNKLNMSEYGRTMGPFFSVFSKWPSAIAGDIVNTMGEKGLLKGSTDNVRRYMAPILVAGMLERATEFDKDDPRNRALFGREGLSSAAPAHAVTSILSGDIFSPPGLDIARKFATGVVTLDPYETWSAGNDALAAYAPGAFVLRLLGTDTPRFQGESPKGTMLGRLVPELDEKAKETRADIDEVLGIQRSRTGR